MTAAASADRVRPRLRLVLIVVVVVLIPLAAHAIWDQVEATRLAHAIATIARRGEPINIASRRSAPPTAENRRAARLYASAADLASWRLGDDGQPGNRDADVERAFASGHPTAVLEDLQRRYVDHEPALELMATASSLDFQGFGSVAPSMYDNASPLDGLNQINDLKADVLIGRGQGSDAADTLVQSVRLQRTMARAFYRYMAFRNIYGTVRLLLRYGHPDSDALTRLQRAFEALPDEDDLAAEIEVDRARILGDSWPYPADASSWALRPQLPSRDGGQSVAFFVLRPLVGRAVREQIAPFDEAIAVARQPWPAKLDAAKALAQHYGVDTDSSRPGRSFLDRAIGFIPAALGVGMLDNELTTAGTTLAYRRTAIAALAVERFRRAHAGTAPASLQALVAEYLSAVPDDPFSGKPLIYHLTADHYDLYSVDANRVDDGGVLYDFGSGSPLRGRRAADKSPRDIGIRVPLTPVH